MSSRTLIIRSSDKDFEAELTRASEIIREGGTVAFPTETVYGLGADALNANAVHRIFEAKGRPADNPLIVHIANKEQCSELAEEIPSDALLLMEKFWPGPLTLILKAKNIVPEVTTGGLDTVGLRMPENPIALELIRRSGRPIAAPSANTSGSPSPTNADHVIQDLEGKIDAVLDGGPTDIGLESTVVDMTGSIPTILRPGQVTADDIRKCIGQVSIGYKDRTLDEDEIARSPGMKYTHYSPKTRVLLIEGDVESVRKAINKAVYDCHIEGERTGLLVTEETAKFVKTDEIYSLGKRNVPAQAARSIFMGLRHLDSKKVDLIVIDGTLNKEGIGAAVFNRLRKAADRIINA